MFVVIFGTFDFPLFLRAVWEQMVIRLRIEKGTSLRKKSSTQKQKQKRSFGSEAVVCAF